jgi:hypothetical protein
MPMNWLLLCAKGRHLNRTVTRLLRTTRITEADPSPAVASP